MIETEQIRCPKDGEENDEREKNFHEYAIITEGLFRDLEECKGEQTRCRSQLDTLLRETKHASQLARECFALKNAEKCTTNENYREPLENLRERISILETEKETVYQMWQMTSKTVDALEEELKSARRDDGASKYYEERISGMKEMYSEAIRALETKLSRAKENFVKNQAVWESCREKTESLSREKSELEMKLTSVESESRAREETNARIADSLRRELKETRDEFERSRDENLQLREKLREARSFATRALAKCEESKIKVSEALEIAETAIAEKDTALQRESRSAEERTRLESRLNAIVDEYTKRLDRELATARESFDRASKKSALEMKEVKIELRDKVTMIDRLERENKSLESELERARRDTEDFLQRSSGNARELEEKLRESREKMETWEEDCRRRYEERIRDGEAIITELEMRLAASEDRFRKAQTHEKKELDERIREADERTREILERYSASERRLARAIDEKENIVCEKRAARADYDREIARRDNERRTYEARIRELQDHLESANNALEKSNSRVICLARQIDDFQKDWREKPSSGSNANEIRSNGELSEKLKALQEKFDRRTRELTHHVETHQKLCQRWKDEVKSLTTKFQSRSKEFREKINILRKENEELNRELLVSRQQLADFRLQLLNRYDRGDEAR